MYKTNPEFVFGFFSNFSGFTGNESGPRTYNGWATDSETLEGWELCCLQHSHKHTSDKPRSIFFSLAKIPSFAHEEHLHGRTTMNNDT